MCSVTLNLLLVVCWLPRRGDQPASGVVQYGLPGRVRHVWLVAAMVPKKVLPGRRTHMLPLAHHARVRAYAETCLYARHACVRAYAALCMYARFACLTLLHPCTRACSARSCSEQLPPGWCRHPQPPLLPERVEGGRADTASGFAGSGALEG